MKNSDHWIICLDLTSMDDILLGYTSYIKAVFKPKTVTFLHVINIGTASQRIIDEYPEIGSEEDFENILRDELNETIDEHFDKSDVEVRTVLKKGRPTNTIIEVVNTLEPDLLIVGKKVGYQGEGIIPKTITKYIPNSILFVPENSRYSLKKALVPVDFSEQSAKALKTTIEIVKEEDGSAIAQHIYRYRAQFFPYAMTEEDKQKLDKEILQKRDKFLKEYNISSDLKFVLSKHNKNKLMDVVYDLLVHEQADLLVIGSKVKALPSLIRQDFIDKAIHYNFGVPVLIEKNREKYAKFLEKLFK